MESCNRTGSTDLRRLLALCTAAGTILLAFAPSGAWLNGASTPDGQLLAVLLKQALTVSLLLIVPALWARLAFRTTPWILLALAGLAYGCGLLFEESAKDALYTLLLLALPGVGLYGLQRFGIGNFRTVLYESFLILAALFGYACLRDLIREGDAFLSTKWILNRYGEILDGYAAVELDVYSAQILSTVRETVDAYRLSPETVCVPALLLPSMAAGLSNTLFSHLMNRRGGAALSPLPAFADWRCERWYVLLIAGFALVTFFLRLARVQNADALAAVAEPLWRLPCSLAGLCTVRSVAIRFRKAWFFWIAVAVLLSIPLVGMLLLTVLGMLSSLKKSSNVGEDGNRK